MTEQLSIFTDGTTCDYCQNIVFTELGLAVYEYDNVFCCLDCAVDYSKYRRMYKESTHTSVVIKVGNQFLEGFNDNYDDDEPNYELTDDHDSAHTFYNIESVPKYAWNHIKEEQIYDLDALCMYLNGTLVKATTVTKKITTTEEMNPRENWK